MRKRVLLLCCVSLMLQLIAVGQEYLIKGHLTGFANGTKFYLMGNSTFKKIDSAVIQHDRLTMCGHLTNPPADMVLYTEGLSKHINLLIGNDTVQIEGDIKSLPNELSITGSETQDVQNELDRILKPGNNKLEALLKKITTANDSATLVVSTARYASTKKDNEVLKSKFALQHLHTYAGLLALRPFNTKNTDTLQYVYDHLDARLKDWVVGLQLAAYLKSTKYLERGSYITDFVMTDKSGGSKRLFDYKGEYLLLYFYTSVNCVLCDNALYDLKNTYNHYGKKITILGISTDGSKADWKNAPGNIPWREYWVGSADTKIADKYGPHLSPAYFVVDPQGKIIYTHLGYMATSGKRGPLEMVVGDLIKDK